MMLRYVVFALIMGVSITIGKTQVSSGGTPPSFKYLSKLKSTLSAEFIIPPDVERLKSEDAMNTRVNAPYRIAENINTEFNIAHNGTWETLPSGENIWRLKIYSPGAMGLRLMYNDFYLPEGSQLFIYNETRTHVIGAFTHNNNNSLQMFATEVIPGETCILEYVSPKNNAIARLNISQVGYIYRGMEDILPAGSRLKAAGNCEVNVNCSPEGDNWQDAKRSVTKIILDKYLCSGTLLNNTARDFKAYISTAFHCIDSIENTAPFWVFYFNYERTECSKVSTLANYVTLTGAWIRAKVPLNQGSDGALLELFGGIPQSYNAYWAGWDRSGEPTSGGAGIHHPGGDVKKISTCTSNWYSTTWHGTGNTDGARGAHWSLVYSKTIHGHGVTEGGSSGSAIFGPDELYRGSLSGGLSSCDNPSYDNLYGKLFFSWDQFSNDSAYQFKCWLDPLKTGETRIYGIDKSNSTGVKVNWTSTNSVVALDSFIIYKDETEGTGLTRTWYFEEGTPATSNEKEPKVYYHNPGSYNVKLEITKDATVYSKQRLDYAIVQPRPAWIMQNTGFSEPAYGISGISIVDSLIVWAWAIDLFDPQKHSTAFTRTTDGGTTWKADTIKFAGIAGYGIGNLYAINKDTAYAAVFGTTAAGGGKILCTRDGGKTWQHQSSALFSPPNGFPNSVYFFNKNQGVAMGDPNDSYFEVYTTENGGNNWSRVIPSKLPVPLEGEYGTTNFYDAKGDTIWFGTTLGRVFRSVDKGKNWNAYSTGLSGSTDVKFKTSKFGFAIKKDSPFTMKKTEDGGITWSTYTIPQNFLKGDIANVPGTKNTWVSVIFNDPSGSSYTIDNGLTYNLIESGVPYTSVAFYNARIGWAGSFNIDSLTGGIYKWNYYNWILTHNPSDKEIKAEDNAQFSIFPNPTDGLISIVSRKTLPKEGLVEVYSLQGSKVMSREIKFVSQVAHKFDISELLPGMYLIKISDGKNMYKTKILKK